jgi:uncharacterized protein YndB with AHSA1/START domain
MTDTKQWDITWEGLLPARPEAVWDAVTRHAAGYLWAVDYEPRVGGAERGLTTGGGTVTAWEPHRRFATRTNPEAERDGLNALEYVFTPHDGGATTLLRYRHQAAVPADDYDRQLTMCRAHTAFYQHSLGLYAACFPGRDPKAYISCDAREGVTFAAVRAALGLPADVVAGDPVTLDAPGGGAPITGVVDYATGPFLGIRTADALYRVYGRDRWGYPCGIAHHRFAPDANQAAETAAWQAWLDAVPADRQAVA